MNFTNLTCAVSRPSYRACVQRRFVEIRECLFLNIGNTIEMTWPRARSSVLKCFSITNTNSGKVKFECDTTYRIAQLKL